MKGQSPDFAALCDKYPELAACAKRRRTDGDDKGTSTTPTFDWTDERTLRTLTEVLLRDEFDVHMVLPADRLTPPVPNRANYIHWLHTALLAGDDASPHHVLDVGVGASCIYPLIGAATHGSWTFHGTDVDARSLQHAEDNVARNPRLRERIQLSLVAPCEALQRAVTQALVLRPPCPTGAGPITTALASFCDGDARRGGRGPIRRALEAAGRVADVKACETAYYDDPSPCVTQPAALQDDALYSVVMTNPPFYDVGEAVAPSPLTVCTGAVHEVATPGGEVAFVAAMLADSLVLRRRVRWYTAMLGKESSLRALTKLLRREGVGEVVTTVFQGAGEAAGDGATDDGDVAGATPGRGRTRRWGLAWSFHPTQRPPSPPLTATLETTAQALRATALPPLPAPDVSVTALLWERVRLAAERYADQHGGNAGAPCDDDDDDAAGDVWVLDVAGWLVHVRVATGADSTSAAAEDAVTVVATLDPAAPAGPMRPHLAPAGVFHAFVELLQAEIARTNRRWRRVLTAAIGGDSV